MRILVACEESGKVRDAFLKLGHDAISCDLIPSRTDGPHIQGDVRDLDLSGYDVMIAFPPCTHLCVSGARWWGAKQWEQAAAIEFFMWFAGAKVKHKAIENPIGIMSTTYRKPDQIIHPWMFGHGETKSTCLWLFDLPKLVPTNIVDGREARVHRMPPGKNRARDRSETYQGIADAMAGQWGNLK